MSKINGIGHFNEFVAWGRAGEIGEVDRLMPALHVQEDLGTTRLWTKGKGSIALLDEAIAAGKIDAEQAYAK